MKQQEQRAHYDAMIARLTADVARMAEQYAPRELACSCGLRYFGHRYQCCPQWRPWNYLKHQRAEA